MMLLATLPFNAFSNCKSIGPSIIRQFAHSVLIGYFWRFKEVFKGFVATKMRKMMID